VRFFRAFEVLINIQSLIQKLFSLMGLFVLVIGKAQMKIDHRIVRVLRQAVLKFGNSIFELCFSTYCLALSRCLASFSSLLAQPMHRTNKTETNMTPKEQIIHA
jgi:hypothetical protein